MKRRPLRTFITSRVARFLGMATLAIVAFVARPSSGRPPIGHADALPHPSELLAQPAWLPHCHMNVVEWRATAVFQAETAQSEEALEVLDDTCRDTFARYGEFLRAERLPAMRTQAAVLPSVSLLPGNVLLDGKSGRALNDLPTRFEAVAPGCCYWGLYVDSLNHLFVRNDPLIKNERGKLVANPRFVRTLTHEISHVLSARLGVWDLVGYDRQRDEELAEQFVAFMGMHFPAESSADDLAYHTGHAPFGPKDEVATATGVRAAHPDPASPPPDEAANTSRQQ